MTNKTLLKRDLSELLNLAWPVILSRLGFMTMGLIDTLVVGRYSTVQLGYHSLGWAVASTMLTAGFGLVSGVQVITARHIGEGRPEATGGVLRRGAVYAFWIGFIVAAISIMGGPPLLVALKLDPVLAKGAGRVLVVFSYSLPLIVTCAAASGYMEGLGRPRIVTWITWGCNLANLVLDLILVPGGFGIPAMGAVGAAWGTFGARVIMIVLLYGYIFAMKDARALGLYKPPIDGQAVAREQRRIGYGAAVTMFVEASAFSGMTVIAGWIGGLAVATWAILLNSAALVFMLPLGLATATAVLVGRAVGAKDRAALKRAGWLGFSSAAAALTVVSVVILIGAAIIARAYTPDPLLIPVVAAGLTLCSLFYLADGLQVVGAHALRAQSDVWIPTLTHTLSYVGVMIPLAWLLAIPSGWGINGIVWAVIVASFLEAGFLIARFWWVSRRVA